MVNTKTYANSLEKKLIAEFKQKFMDKLGYEPVILTRTDTDEDIPLMSLEQLEGYFVRYLPRIGKSKIPLTSKSRKRQLVELRNMFCAMARSMNFTLKEIGVHLGGRDHSTAIHSIKTFHNLMDTNKAFRDKYYRILKNIKRQHEPTTMDSIDSVQSKPEPAVLP